MNAASCASDVLGHRLRVEKRKSQSANERGFVCFFARDTNAAASRRVSIR